MWLAPRSVVVMWDDARFCWKHAIASRTTDHVVGLEGSGDKDRPTLKTRQRRVSLTYRRVREPFCDCKAVHLCDYQNPDSMQLPNRIAMAAKKK